MGQQVLVLWDLGQYLVVEQSVLLAVFAMANFPPSPLPRSPPRLFAELRALKRGRGGAVGNHFTLSAQASNTPN